MLNIDFFNVATKNKLVSLNDVYEAMTDEYDLLTLLKAFYLVHQKHPDYQLKIIGLLKLDIF